MDEITVVIQAFTQGILDSLRGTVSLFYLDGKINEKIAIQRVVKSKDIKKRSKDISNIEIRDGKVLKRIIQCCGLNGGVCWLSIILFEYLLLPLVQYSLLKIFGQSTFTNTLSLWMQLLLSWTFSTFWALPLFLLSKVVNSLWFQDIADSAFWCSQGRSQYFSSYSKFIADSLFSVVIQTLFLLQAMIVSLIPLPSYLSYLFEVIHMCMLYSLYAFEYKWYKVGWELNQRLLYIETNWPYFIGFGFPLALLTSLPTSCIISGCVFSILFPLFIISANEAKPINCKSRVQLQLFSLVIYISNIIFNKTIKRSAIPASQRKKFNAPQIPTSTSTSSPSKLD